MLIVLRTTSGEGTLVVVDRCGEPVTMIDGKGTVKTEKQPVARGESIMHATRIIDSHIHCGVQHVDLPYEEIQKLLRRQGISGACMFAPVEDI
jgi:hypothetical protein